AADSGEGRISSSLFLFAAEADISRCVSRKMPTCYGNDDTASKNSGRMGFDEANGRTIFGICQKNDGIP
ncbi:hypothetical protein P9213_07920, partial [Geobacillus stearothermophilus]|uniref:hypothetical protein n=1 Tax=Geobacillus stearothermophilus TaxID=1422 RepID=UPI002E21F9D4|nr:hypothetical protein [Geobacillus stearothermophilus]